MPTPSTCDTCGRPSAACVCERIVAFATRLRVLILQHPREQDAVLGSAQLVAASLPKAQIAVGLSWRNLGHALAETGAGKGHWAVLFPHRDAHATTLTGGQTTTVDATSLDGIVALDGTWSQAKSLWWRNPWLLRLQRMTIVPASPSIYGKLRPEPSRRHVSTLEAVAAALSVCGEPPEIERGLRRVFRTLVQRCRDGGFR